MITYSLWLYELDSRHISDFAAAFRERGTVYELLRQIPGHIHTDILKRFEIPSGTSRILGISFFTSVEASLYAEQSPEKRLLNHWVREHASHCFHLGIFSFLPTAEAEIPPGNTHQPTSTLPTPKGVSG